MKYWLNISKSDYNNCIVKSVYCTVKEGIEKNENIESQDVTSRNEIL